MMIERAYKYRFYSNKELRELLAKIFVSCRFVYNYFFNKKQKLWKKKEHITLMNCCLQLTKLKQEKSWLKEIFSVYLQQLLRSLNKAYQKFFKKKAKYPHFKSKYARQSTYYIKNSFIYRKGKIILAKTKKPLKITWSRKLKKAPSFLTVSKDACGRYFVSIIVKEKIFSLYFVQRDVALDLGLKNFSVNNKGEKEPNLRFLKQSRNRIINLQQSLSRKKKKSNNRNRARIKLVRLHQRVTDKRRDYLHKLSLKIVNENQVIKSEDLKVKNMQKNRRSAFSISDVSWSSFLSMLKYKIPWYGRDFVQLDTFFLLRKICSNCGYKNKELLLSQRSWVCLKCDWDKNAALNLSKEGLNILIKGTVGHAGSHKLVELEGGDLMTDVIRQPAVNQEP